MKISKDILDLNDAKKLYSSSNYLSRAVLNKDNMMNEETTLASFIDKQFLKLHYFNKDFNLFITE